MRKTTIRKYIEMAGDLNRRETHRLAVIRIRDFTFLEEFNTANIYLLKEKQRQLRAAFERFNEEHLAILDAVEAADLGEQHTFLEGVENAYAVAQAAIAEKIAVLQDAQEERELERSRQREATQNSFNTANGNEANRANSTTNNANEEMAAGQRANGAENNNNANINQPEPTFRNKNIQLEPIKLPTFDGDYTKWSEWRSSYDSLVHTSQEVTSSHKFHILKSRLSGSAERVLSGWNVTGESYLAAYDTLVKVYDNKYRITMAHLEEFFAIPTQLNETLESLRVMIDTTNRCVRQLEVIGEPVGTWDHMIVYNLIVRMPPTTQNLWETSHELCEMPSLKQVLNFLEKRSNGFVNMTRFGSHQSLNQISNNNNGAKHTGANNRQNNQRNNFNPSANKNVPKGGLTCHNCKLPHTMMNCATFKSMPVRERENRVRELKLCLNCFSPNHAAKSLSCKSGPCHRCKKGLFHNSLLCRMPIASVASTKQVQIYQPGQPQADLRIAPVQNTNNGASNVSTFQDFH